LNCFTEATVSEPALMYFVAPICVTPLVHLGFVSAWAGPANVTAIAAAASTAAPILFCMRTTMAGRG
jgi:hypothetical protein